MSFAYFLPGKTDVIEGDIMIDDKLKHVIDVAMNSKKNGRRKRDTVRYQQRKWKDAIIPYIIDGSVGKLIDKSTSVVAEWEVFRLSIKDIFTSLPFSFLSVSVDENAAAHPGGRGRVHDLRMDGALPPGFQEGTLF